MKAGRKAVCLLLAAIMLCAWAAASGGEGDKFFFPGQDMALFNEGDVQVVLKGDQSEATFADGLFSLPVEVINDSGKAVTVRFSGEANGISLHSGDFEKNLCEAVPAHETMQGTISNLEAIPSIQSIDDLKTLSLSFSVYNKRKKLLAQGESGFVMFGSTEPATEDGAEMVYSPGKPLALFSEDGLSLYLSSVQNPRENEILISLDATVTNESDKSVMLLFQGKVNGVEMLEGDGFEIVSPGGNSACFEPHATTEATLFLPTDGIPSIKRYDDLESIEFTFTGLSAQGERLFETQPVVVRIEHVRPSPAPIEPETAYAEYSDEELVAWLRALSEGMRAVTVDTGDGPACYRLADRGEGQLVGSFAACLPTLSAQAVDDRLFDLPLSADWLLFDLYDAQRDGQFDAISPTPIDLPRLGEIMPDGWRSFRSFDFAAGSASDGDTRWFWEPIYYEDASGGILDDAVYMSIFVVTEGSDLDMLDALKVYCPLPDDYSAEHWIVSDSASVARFLEILGRLTDLEDAQLNVANYTLLKRNNQGDAVKAIQQRLSDLGFMTSSVDGYYGPMTEEAVRAYQEAEGLEATGEADPETQQRLLREERERALLSDWLSQRA